MLQLVLGKTGTGKTTALLERAMRCAREGVKTILLVPEQFSFEAERWAFSVLHGAAALNLSVLSFSRLSENIFRTHGGLTGKRLTDTIRVVLMRLAVDEMKDILEVYQGQSAKSHFLMTMLETVEELKQAGISPEQLPEIVRTVEDQQLGMKLGDIANIFGAYEALVERSYTDPLDDISKAVELAVEHRYFTGAQVFVDGFGFFSPPEREMLYAMMEQAEGITVSLCADGLNIRDGVDIFYDQKSTAQRLLAYAREHFVQISPPELLQKNYRTQRSALLFVEELSSGDDPPEDETVSPEGLTILEAVTDYDELRFVGGEIARLVRDEGYRYRDFAIVCRRVEDYRMGLRAVLEDRGIPFFMDRKESIQAKPIVALVTAALEAACGNLRTEAVLKVARSPAIGLSMEDSAGLENYAYIWSVQGESWLAPFRNNPTGLSDDPPESYTGTLEKIEGARLRVMEPLETLRKSLRGCDGKGFSSALYRYVQATGALANLTAAFAGDEETSHIQTDENDRLWNSIVDILDLFTEVLGDHTQSLRDMAALFELALGQTQLGHIPSTNDQVIAGSADTVRLASPRAVFVLGVNEGYFPARVGPHGIFTDAERGLLLQQGVEIASPALQRALQERFYLYSALCSPRERLYVSYTLTDKKGDPAQPSLTITRLRQRFPQAVKNITKLPETFFVSNLDSARNSYAQVVGGAGREKATLEELLKSQGDVTFLEAIRRTLKDAPMSDIEPAYAKDLLGGRVILSPSRIETYYQCPYRFFCNYMLKLSPRRQVQYTPLESGNAIHFVLEMLLRELGGRGIGSLTDPQLGERIAAYLTLYIEKIVPDPAGLAARFRYQFQRLSSLLFTILRHIGNEFDQSMFTAAGMEVTVGMDGDVRPAQLRLGDGTIVELVGKIDRVDTYEDDTGKYVRVVDYKSGGKTFRLEDVAFGLNMQMLIYLFALCDDTAQHFGEVQPAGILYMPGNLSAARVAAGEEDPAMIQDKLAKGLAMSGVVLDDEHILRAMERELEGRYIPVKLKNDQNYTSTSKVRTKEEFLALREMIYKNIGSMAGNIMAGKLAPLPARSSHNNPCDYCEFHQLCNDCDGAVCRDISGGGNEEGGDEDGQGSVDAGAAGGD